MTEQFGLSNAELARHKTVYAHDAMAGRVAVVSGGSGGIGSAIAWLFARLGASVVITGRKPEKITPLVDAIRNAGLDASGEAVNIRDRTSVDAFWEKIWHERGRVDSLINSAGGQFPSPAMEISEKGWNAVIDTNLTGTWNMMQAAARKWRDAETPGDIVNIVVVTTGGLHGVAHTIAARCGIIGLSQAVAVEWAEHGIRVNCVAPGAIETEGWQVYSPEARATYPQSNPMMRVGSAWDIAESCAYLSATSGNFVSGVTLTVDGAGQHWGETWTTGKPAWFRHD